MTREEARKYIDSYINKQSVPAKDLHAIAWKILCSHSSYEFDAESQAMEISSGYMGDGGIIVPYCGSTTDITLRSKEWLINNYIIIYTELKNALND